MTRGLKPQCSSTYNITCSEGECEIQCRVSDEALDGKDTSAENEAEGPTKKIAPSIIFNLNKWNGSFTITNNDNNISG